MDTVATPAASCPEDTDHALVRRITQGDTQAFEVLMRRYNARLYRAARSILKDDSEAEDAVQEAYWKAYCALATFRAEAQLSTWLTRIAINEALIRLRRNKRRAAVIQLDDDSNGTSLLDIMEHPASQHDSPAQLAWRGELRHLIERRIDELPDDFRTVFILRAVEEMPAVEVAQVLDIPEATVRTRYLRARQRLREALSGDMDTASRDAFAFDGERCDRIVEAVLARITREPRQS
ncbi:RNA polymerase sigma factor [Pusillimonas sp. TS35]|uniref:RNA polymerase sigma factor n=1 Tax=Paracandidimonas lactea TaxID=2895524 RepID=UPI001368D2CF|nr:RNA polymerase sigma factor [Paracandidimonas lactea]MYN14752.1 RNA polymerase sigma factor [Pusillimonas sp. TS35]